MPLTKSYHKIVSLSSEIFCLEHYNRYPKRTPRVIFGLYDLLYTRCKQVNLANYQHKCLKLIKYSRLGQIKRPLLSILEVDEEDEPDTDSDIESDDEAI